MKTILITGGTGLVGSRLSQLLLAKNYQVRFLSRNKQQIPNIEVFEWDIKEGYIDPAAFEGVESIVHLAGAGVADKAWSEARKKVILESRTQSTSLLNKYLKDLTPKPKSFISASAIGLYGLDTGETLLKENAPAGSDFLANVTRAWEDEVEQITQIGLRTAKLRIGIVLSEKGGALEKIAQPIRFGLGAALGSGKQYLSWIHIDDLCRMFIHAIENEEVKGAYNAVASKPVDNALFSKITAKVLNRPFFLPNVPRFVLKTMLGEMANIVLGGNKVSNEKIKASNFEFKFDELEPALRDLLK